MPKTSSDVRKTQPGTGISSRYRALLLTHRSLDEKLEAELKRPLPDSSTVRRLKRRKLSIKDELASINRLFEALSVHDERHRAAGLTAA